MFFFACACTFEDNAVVGQQVRQQVHYDDNDALRVVGVCGLISVGFCGFELLLNELRGTDRCPNAGGRCAERLLILMGRKLRDFRVKSGKTAERKTQTRVYNLEPK